jgi:hypothetical protein
MSTKQKALEVIPSAPGADSAGSPGACYVTRRSGGAQ